MSINHNMSLLEIETLLTKRSNDIVIISQVFVSSEELQAILSIVKTEMEIKEEHNQMVFIWTMYPLTCLVLTVHFAIHMYDGNFWGNLRKALKIEKDHTWKVLFYRALTKRRLIDFNINDSQKYLTNVLGHAGVPKNNVAALINSVIIPAVEYGISAPEVVEQIRYEQNNEIKVYHLYKGVKDFIKLGREVSLGFIERCIHIWREHKKPFVKNYEGYLPMHILEEFDNYTSNNTYTKLSKYYQINRPKLKYDPSSQKVYISLPNQKLKLNDVTEVSWKIYEHESKLENEISTFSVEYANRSEQEFIVDEQQRRNLVKPSSTYKVTLLYDEENMQSWVFRTNQWMLFDPSLFEQESDLTKSYERILLIGTRRYLEHIDDSKSDIFINPLFGTWQGYYEIEINALINHEYNLGSNKLIMQSNLDKPYLKGERWSNLKHNHPIYSSIPYIVLPKDYESVFDFNRLRITVSNVWSNDSESLLVCEIGNVSENSEGDKLIPLKGLFPLPLFGEYEISIIGSLGSDIKFNMIYLSPNDFSTLINDNAKEYTVWINSSKQIEMNIVSPSELVPRLKSDRGGERTINFNVNHQLSQFLLQLRNMKTQESIIVKCFTTLFRIHSVCDTTIFEQGSVTNKQEFDLSKAHIILDLENPDLLQYGKSLYVQFLEITADGEKAIYNQSLASGRKHLISYKYFDGLTVNADRRIISFKISGIMKTEQPLILIDTTWHVSNIRAKLLDDKLKLTWEQNYVAENIKLYVWALHEPMKGGDVYSMDLSYGSEEALVSLPNSKNSYYLFEWRKENYNDPFAIFVTDNKPKINHSNTYIYSTDGDQDLKKLSKRVLLQNKFDEEYERSKEDIVDLLSSVNAWGESYVDTLLTGYDYCCDFGIQNIDNLISLYNDKSTDNEFLELMDRITGFQEWDDDSMLAIINRYKTKNKSQSIRLEMNEFGAFAKDSRMLLTKNKEELNYILQTIPYQERLIEDFSIRHTLIEFLLKSIIDNEFKHHVTNLVNSNYKKLSTIYNKYLIELRIPNSIRILMNSRSTRVIEVSYSYLPLMMAYTALLTRSLANFEFHFSDNERIFIRNLAKELFVINREWFIHDLFFLTLTQQQIKQEERLTIERRKQYGNPSFSWKGRN